MEWNGAGHLSLNGAIQSGQNHPNVSRHVGSIGPQQFAGLMRTFTGHFHSHQTMLQRPPGTTVLLCSQTFLPALI
jgi:hypothetical protein